ncbi:MAG: hypothetical protein SVZ03_00885 [Spirochaetota bacterium]|nr:hypothetical protein [Spirochaetota bacterium]
MITLCADYQQKIINTPEQLTAIELKINTNVTTLMFFSYTLLDNKIPASAGMALAE